MTYAYVIDRWRKRGLNANRVNNTPRKNYVRLERVK